MTDPDCPCELARLMFEADARILADYLKSLGLTAHVTGGQLLGIAAEGVLPDVRVLVRAGDLERAQAAREELARNDPRMG